MSNRKTTKQSIVTTQQTELGQALVARADENLRRSTQLEFQKCVDEVLRQIDESQRTLRIASAALEFFQARKLAVETGQFSFHPWRKVIIYNDDNLNKNYQDNPANFRQINIP